MRPRRYVLLLTAPILATGVLLLVVGGAAAWYVHRLNRDVSDLLPRNLECTLASERLVLSIRDARTEMHRFLDSGSRANLQAVVTIERLAAQHLREAEQAATTDDLRELIGRTRQQHRSFFADFVLVTQGMAAATQQQKVRELTQSVTINLLAPRHGQRNRRWQGREN